MRRPRTADDVGVRRDVRGLLKVELAVSVPPGPSGAPVARRGTDVAPRLPSS